METAPDRCKVCSYFPGNVTACRTEEFSLLLHCFYCPRDIEKIEKINQETSLFHSLETDREYQKNKGCEKKCRLSLLCKNHDEVIFSVENEDSYEYVFDMLIFYSQQIVAKKGYICKVMYIKL